MADTDTSADTSVSISASIDTLLAVLGSSPSSSQQWTIKSICDAIRSCLNAILALCKEKSPSSVLILHQNVPLFVYHVLRFDPFVVDPIDCALLWECAALIGNFGGTLPDSLRMEGISAKRARDWARQVIRRCFPTDSYVSHRAICASKSEFLAFSSSSSQTPATSVVLDRQRCWFSSLGILPSSVDDAVRKDRIDAVMSALDTAEFKRVKAMADEGSVKLKVPPRATEIASRLEMQLGDGKSSSTSDVVSRIRLLTDGCLPMKMASKEADDGEDELMLLLKPLFAAWLPRYFFWYYPHSRSCTCSAHAHSFVCGYESMLDTFAACPHVIKLIDYILHHVYGPSEWFRLVRMCVCSDIDMRMGLIITFLWSILRRKISESDAESASTCTSESGNVWLVSHFTFPGIIGQYEASLRRLWTEYEYGYLRSGGSRVNVSEKLNEFLQSCTASASTSTPLPLKIARTLHYCWHEEAVSVLQICKPVSSSVSVDIHMSARTCVWYRVLSVFNGHDNASNDIVKQTNEASWKILLMAMEDCDRYNVQTMLDTLDRELGRKLVLSSGEGEGEGDQWSSSILLCRVVFPKILHVPGLKYTRGDFAHLLERVCTGTGATTIHTDTDRRTTKTSMKVNKSESKRKSKRKRARSHESFDLDLGVDTDLDMIHSETMHFIALIIHALGCEIDIEKEKEKEEMSQSQSRILFINLIKNINKNNFKNIGADVDMSSAAAVKTEGEIGGMKMDGEGEGDLLVHLNSLGPESDTENLQMKTADIIPLFIPHH